MPVAESTRVTTQRWPIHAAGLRYEIVRRHALREGEEPLHLSEAAFCVEQWSCDPRHMHAVATLEAAWLGRRVAQRGGRRPLLDALSQGALYIVHLPATPVSIASPTRVAVLGPSAIVTFDFAVHVVDCTEADLSGIELRFDVDGRAYSATTNAGGIGEVKGLPASRGKVGIADREAVHQHLRKPWSKPLVPKTYPASQVRSIDAFTDVALDATQPMPKIVLAPLDLVVRMTVPGTAKLAKLAHTFELESDDGKLHLKEKAASAVIDGAAHELWFTHLRESRAYKLTVERDAKKIMLFDYTPYSALVGRAGSGLRGKLPASYYP